VSAGHSKGGQTSSGHPACSQAPPTHVIAGQPVPPGTGQHSPQLAPSSEQGSPGLGCRPHQHTGSGSATAHDHVPPRHSHHMPPPHALPPPREQVAPSRAQATGGPQGSSPGGHSPDGHDQVVPSHTQSGPGGGPQHVGGHVARSTVPGGQTHAPSTQIGARPASLPQVDTQTSGLPPPHVAASPPGPASSPGSMRDSAQPSVGPITRRRARRGRMSGRQARAMPPDPARSAGVTRARLRPGRALPAQERCRTRAGRRGRTGTARLSWRRDRPVPRAHPSNKRLSISPASGSRTCVPSQQGPIRETRIA
jgi:hypothetical protein